MRQSSLEKYAKEVALLFAEELTKGHPWNIREAILDGANKFLEKITDAKESSLDGQTLGEFFKAVLLVFEDSKYASLREKAVQVLEFGTKQYKGKVEKKCDERWNICRCSFRIYENRRRTHPAFGVLH